MRPCSFSLVIRFWCELLFATMQESLQRFQTHQDALEASMQQLKLEFEQTKQQLQSRIVVLETHLKHGETSMPMLPCCHDHMNMFSSTLRKFTIHIICFSYYFTVPALGGNCGVGLRGALLFQISYMAFQTQM